MFGGQDDAAMGAQPGAGTAPQNDTLSGVTELVGGVATPGPGDPGFASQDSKVASDEPEGLPPLGQPADPAPNDTPSNDAPADEPAADPSSDESSESPAEEEAPAKEEDSAPAPSDRPEPATSSDPADEGLLELKQQALQQLTPLVGQLDQTPEEKFRTTMMLIQAADNKALLQEAYDAAQAIGDEKVKAQALLDVINEINYFTQKQQD